MKNNFQIFILLVLVGIGFVILFELDYFFIPLLPPQNLTDVEIKLDRTACFGTCPIYSITLFDDGTVIYEGKQFVRIEGIQTYTIPEEKVGELIGLFYTKNFFSLRNSYDASVTDLPTVITSITIQNETKTVSNYADAGPDRLHDLELKIDEITDSQTFWEITSPNPDQK